MFCLSQNIAIFVQRQKLSACDLNLDFKDSYYFN